MKKEPAQNYMTENTGKDVLVPIHEKYLLTIREAAAYFNLGIKRLRRLAEDNTGSFSIRNESHYMIIRPKFEQFLVETTSI